MSSFSLYREAVLYLHPAPLKFPSQGCWEVTAKVGDVSMTFVMLAIWVPTKPEGWGGS